MIEISSSRVRACNASTTTRSTVQKCAITSARFELEQYLAVMETREKKKPNTHSSRNAAQHQNRLCGVIYHKLLAAATADLARFTVIISNLRSRARTTHTFWCQFGFVCARTSTQKRYTTPPHNLEECVAGRFRVCDASARGNPLSTRANTIIIKKHTHTKRHEACPMGEGNINI